MPFISNYNGAMQILSEIGTGKCKGNCKSIWVRNLRYALKTKTNPLKLTLKQRKIMTEKLKDVSGKNMYESKPNKNKICSWKII